MQIMKKTLIASFVLACTSFANTEYTVSEYNDWLSSAVSDAAYKTGDDYTLSFVLGSFPQGSPATYGGMFFTLGENWGLYTQGWQYLAFDDSTTNDRSGLTTSTGTYASSNTNTASGSVEQKTEGWFYNLGGSGMQSGVTITLARLNGVDSVSVNKGDTDIANFIITGNMPLNATVFQMNAVAQSGGHQAFVQVQAATFSANGVNRDIALPIPEPATATLSVLALVGFAARRRRK